MQPTDTTTDLATERRERALLIDDLLAEHYGAPFIPFSYRDPLSELVNALMSHRTKNAVTRGAFKNLRATFPTWEDVISADTAAVERAIRAVTFPEIKAPRIQEALRQVAERNDGELSLEGLNEVSVADARTWLEAIPGVGAKNQRRRTQFQPPENESVSRRYPPPPGRLTPWRRPGKVEPRKDGRHPSKLPASGVGRSARVRFPPRLYAPRSARMHLPTAELRSMLSRSPLRFCNE